MKPSWLKPKQNNLKEIHTKIYENQIVENKRQKLWKQKEEYKYIFFFWKTVLSLFQN